MYRFGIIAALAVGLLSTAKSQTTIYDTYVPSETPVAILPVINRSGEKVAEDRTKQSRFGSEELVKRFSERGFKLISSADIDGAIRDQKLDLDDEENYRRASLFPIGKAVKARLLVFVVIDSVDQRNVQKTFVQSKVAKANLRIWFLDIDSEKPLMTAFRQEASSEGGGMFPAFEKGSARMPIAVANAVRKAFDPFFRPYKTNKTKK